MPLSSQAENVETLQKKESARYSTFNKFHLQRAPSRHNMTLSFLVISIVSYPFSAIHFITVAS
jgi:hypothetical protein